jgi:simple sugar transport system permease protein
MFLIGGELGQSRLGLPNALTGVFQGLLLFLLLACDTLIDYRPCWRRAVPVHDVPTPQAQVPAGGAS